MKDSQKLTDFAVMHGWDDATLLRLLLDAIDDLPEHCAESVLHYVADQWVKGEGKL